MKLNKRSKSILIKSGIALIAVGAVLTIATSVMLSMPATINMFLGGDKLVTEKNEQDLDGNYYDYKTNSTTESIDFAHDATEKITSEGFVLLKNDSLNATKKSLPLTHGAKVSLFGYYALHQNMSGGEDPRTVEGSYPIDKGLQEVGFNLNPTLNSMYEASNGEVDVKNFSSEVKASYNNFNDAAIVVIKRNSGEGNDQERDLGASEDHRTGLSLKNIELDLIAHACENFDNVIIVINSANTMELGFLNGGSNYVDPYNGKTYDFGNIKSAIWVGGTGSYGAISLGKIIEGTVNPSGHLPDTYAANLKDDPTYKNFGSYKYTNSADAGSYSDNSYFVEYEEGVYVGYKYYETAAYEASKGNYTGFNYDSAVTYPFGYGLSYTDFTKEISGTPTFDVDSDSFIFHVKIKNTGSVIGKDVAQIYVNTPYISGGIEKSHVVLGGYAKSKLLNPNEEEIVTIKVKKDYFTSYDYKDEKAYILDAGDYNFYLSDNAHSWFNIDKNDAKKCFTYNVAKKQIFNGVNKRETDLEVATNKFDEELNWKFKDTKEAGFATNFSRANFKGTFPTSPEGQDLVANDYILKTLKKYDVWSESEQNIISEMPVTESKETKYTLADMRGIDYSDPRWESYISQFSIADLTKIYSKGNWQSPACPDQGVMKSNDMDGPYGFFGWSNPPVGNKWYQAAPVLAATWNVEMAKLMGTSIGEEAQAQRYKESGGFTLTGWYGPGLNTHRSAFGGRNYEYFSEDSVLGGTMAASEVSAASEKGVICYMKHFVLNNQETNRQNNGYCAWVNEQALRETYIKGFEIYTKESKMSVNYYGESEDGKLKMVSKTMPAATGIMTAYNRVGAVYAGASETVDILRNECGFVGTSITDAGGEPNTYMNSDQGLRYQRTNMLLSDSSIYDNQSATAVYYLKQSAHTVLYNKSNSNCMIGFAPGTKFHYTMSDWRISLIAGWATYAGLVVLFGVFTVLTATNIIKFKEKDKKETIEHSDEY